MQAKGRKEYQKMQKFFFKHQNDWLDRSASRERKEDRQEDLQKFLVSIRENEKYEEIKEYLEADDAFLYVKIFALQFFTIHHLKKYLPKGDEELINNVSIALVSNLPKKDNDIVKYSPFFTDLSGNLIPDEYLYNGILTPSVAEKMLNMTDLSLKIATRTNIEDEEDIQDADEMSEDDKEIEGHQHNVTSDPEFSEKLNSILEEIEDDSSIKVAD